MQIGVACILPVRQPCCGVRTSDRLGSRCLTCLDARNSQITRAEQVEMRQLRRTCWKVRTRRQFRLRSRQRRAVQCSSRGGTRVRPLPARLRAVRRPRVEMLSGSSEIGSRLPVRFTLSVMARWRRCGSSSNACGWTCRSTPAAYDKAQASECSMHAAGSSRQRINQTRCHVGCMYARMCACNRMALRIDNIMPPYLPCMR